MLALQLTDVKDFMNKFLRSETFDHFLLQEGVITSGASYVIDGHIHPDFYTSEEMEENDITGVFLNIRFQNQQLTLTTGISYRIFSVDKTLDNEWDRLVKQFLKQHEIAFEEL